MSEITAKEVSSLFLETTIVLVAEIEKLRKEKQELKQKLEEAAANFQEEIENIKSTRRAFLSFEDLQNELQQYEVLKVKEKLSPIIVVREKWRNCPESDFAKRDCEAWEIVKKISEEEAKIWAEKRSTI
jgi:hypothetical protein